jgi:enamine deaminase RidA (YjgF/YER057c/UK114 family)
MALREMPAGGKSGLKSPRTSATARFLASEPSSAGRGFILDLDQNLPLLNEVWVQHFGKNLPARTVVGVAKLRENYPLEIEATAYLP